MNIYKMKSPTYYAVKVKGRQEFLKNGKDFYYVLENEDEIDEFAKKFNMGWYWNMRKGILSFKDKSEGVKLLRPEYVKIGDVVAAYDDCGTWRVDLWDLEAFEKNFIGIKEQNGD